ncbi:MAG: iron-dependent repressor [Flavobacteriales bacterium]|nr:iron-dependent repressor [Flavobacteriales bacterium]|tara:strand:+ start:595 stop:1248 length:654 start_codon:yes stop_codon:yes gene_type:complete
MNTLAEENYLKAIFKLSGKQKASVSTNAIAVELETKASSVTDMIKKLTEKGFVNYQKYNGTSLTKKGHEIAVHIVRKHRLWEVFLVKKLNFQWDEVHDVAEQLEHIKSSKLVEHLDTFLGFPQYDPHGDPIPNKNGEFPKSFSAPLIDLTIGNKGKVVGVSQDNPSFLKYLDKLEIQLGSKIQVIEKVDFDQSIEVKINGKATHISSEVAKNILIKQ